MWATLHDKVPAEVESLRGRDYFAAQAVQSEATTRITVRWKADYAATQRILHHKRGVTTVYNPTIPLPDGLSGLEYTEIYCTTGVNEGA